MLKLMGKNIFTILRSTFCLSKPMLSLLWSIVVDAAATLVLGCLCVSFIRGGDWTSLFVSSNLFLGVIGKKEGSKMVTVRVKWWLCIRVTNNIILTMPYTTKPWKMYSQHKTLDKPPLITWRGVNISLKFLPKQLRYLDSFAEPWFCTK